ncbi:reverse transcriptase domain-containing protein [Tanacetum coccineum]
MSNVSNKLKNMMANFFQMNTASTSGTGSLPSNTVANPKGELKAITTRSGLVLDGPTVPMPPPFINPEEDERVEETLTDPEHGEDPRYPHIPYPSRMNQEKQKEKDEVQIHKFWHMFKQLHINISLADALILILKYQKMLKSLLSNNGENLFELANTPLNENCSAVILKKLPEKLGDPGKFLIPCGFSELKCKALADLGASINLMPLSVWKKLGLPELISTQMTLELANRDICTSVGIARDVFVPVGKFTFPADFVIVDYESDPLNDDIFDPEEDIIKNLLNLDKTKDLPPYHDNPLRVHRDLARITFPPGNDDLPFDAESDLREIDYLLNHNPIKEMGILFSKIRLMKILLITILVDTFTEMFTIEHASLIIIPQPLWDDFVDELFVFVTLMMLTYDDPFDSKEEKIKESKLLIDELDPPRSSDFLPFPECDLVFYEDFSKVDALPSTNNEDKVFNPGYSYENLLEVTNCATPEKNVKKLTNTSLILEDFNPPLYELPFHKEVPGLGALLSFSF